MAHIIATDSCHSQQLIRVPIANNLQPMVANTKKDFAQRLNQACDNANPPIASGRGRRAELRRRVIGRGLTVSGESVRKWLSAESIPSMDNIRFIAITLAVNADWLLTGRTPRKEDVSTYATNNLPTEYKTNEPAPLPFTTPRQKQIQEIVDLLQRTSDIGIAIVRDKAKDISQEFPTNVSQTGS